MSSWKLVEAVPEEGQSEVPSQTETKPTVNQSQARSSSGRGAGGRGRGNSGKKNIVVIKE